MTRDEQIDAALMLLDPPMPEHEAWRHRIEHILDSLDWQCKVVAGFKAPSTKPGKAALQAYVKALRQLQKKYAALPPELRPWFSLAVTANLTVVERELAKAEPLLPKGPALPKRDAILGKAATLAACRLLLLRGRKPSLTRDGEWEQLGKILSNGASVFEHMRAFKRSKLYVATVKDVKTETEIGFFARYEK